MVSDQTSTYAADKNLMPQHIAIVMDGNGRWAKKRFLPVLPDMSKAWKRSGGQLKEYRSQYPLSDGFCVQLGKLEKTGRGSQFPDEPVSFFS